jgi:hypothetical protein
MGYWIWREKVAVRTSEEGALETEAYEETRRPESDM